MADLELAYQKLAALDEADALLALTAIEDRRQQQHFAKYWSCDQDANHQIFFDSIESDFSKFTPETKIFGFLGGNRSSKTERGAFIAVAWLMGKEYFRDEPSWRYVKNLPIPDHGCNVWCVGLDFSVIRDVIWGEKLKRGHQHPGLLPAMPCQYITRCSDSEFQINVDVNGRKSTLTCKSADSGREKMQSASVDLVWIDEETDVEVYDELYQRTSDCAGKILITLTPLSDVGSGAKKPWVYDLHREFKSGRKDVCFVSLSVLDNPFVPEDEKQKLKEKWAGHVEERARLYGDFIKRSGLVYPQWDRKVHVLNKQNLPSEWRRIVSIDPSVSGVTAALWACISPRNDVYLYREYYEKDMIISEHAKNLLLRNAGDKIDIWIIDPFFGASRNPETHKQAYQLYRDAGCPVRLAPRAEDYGRDTMAEYLSASLNQSSRSPKLYIVGNMPQFVNEIEGYIWDSYAKGVMKGMSKDKPLKRNDHLINSCQYLLSMKPRGKVGGSINPFNAANSYT